MNEPTLTDTEQCCEHSLSWHHERRGCGYHGFAPSNRCPCLLTFDEALTDFVAARVAEAVDRERAAWATKIETLIASDPHYQPRRDALEEALALLAADDAEGNSWCSCGHDWERHGREVPGCIECRCRRLPGEAKRETGR